MNQKLILAILTTCFGILASLSAWICASVHELSVKTVELRQMVLDGKEARLTYQNLDLKQTTEFVARNDESHRRIETTVATLVSRPEFETKIAEIKLELKQLDQKLEEIRVRVSTIEIEVRNLKGKNEKIASSNIDLSGTNYSSAGVRSFQYNSN